MKKLLPLAAAAAILAACGYQDYDGRSWENRNDHHHVNGVHDDRPGDHSNYGGDSLSDRSLGSVRGAHNEPLVNRERDREPDGYYYVPAYDSYYHGRTWRR